MNPFRNQCSLTHKAFELTTKGTTLDEIRQLAEKSGGDGRRLIKLLRMGTHKDFVWQVDEYDGKFEIKEVRQNVKEVKHDQKEEEQQSTSEANAEGHHLRRASAGATQRQATSQGEE